MIPTPQSLDYGPELGVLTLLDAALDMSIRTLAAKYPQLDDPAERDWTVPPPEASAALAAVVAGLADTLRCAVLHYISTMENEHDDPPMEMFIRRRAAAAIGYPARKRHLASAVTSIDRDD